MVFAGEIRLNTSGGTDIVDVTQEVQSEVRKSGIRDGIVTVFVPGSTAGITSIEYESGLIDDLKAAFDRLAPRGISYKHDERWGDGNGFSHVRAAMLGPSFSAPIRAGVVMLGTWQQIVLIDFDNRPRSRKLLVQAVGE